MAISIPESFSLDNLKRLSDGIQNGIDKDRQILESLRIRRNKLTSESLKAVSKLTEVENIHSKLTDQFNLVNTQVSHEELAIKKLNDEMEAIRKTNEEIENETQRIQDNLTETLFQFEDQVDELSKLFTEAEIFYAPDNIDIEMDQLNKKIDEISNQQKVYLDEIANLTRKFEEMAPDKNESLKIALKLITEENQQVKIKFNEKKKKL